MSRTAPQVLLVVGLVVGAFGGAGIAFSALDGGDAPGADGPGEYSPPDVGDPGTAPIDGETGVAQFENESAFRSYLENGQLLAGGGFRMGGAVAAEPALGAPTDAAVDATTGDAAVPASAEAGNAGGDGSDSSRIGTTNVQVAGLDEPDLVKTDGRNFYYAPRGRYARIGPVEPGPAIGAPDREIDGRTHVIDASDPPNPDVIAGIDASGRLLQTGDTLVVIGGEGIVGYDVSDPAEPTEAWRTPLNASVVTARERNGTLYLVTETRVAPGTPCPMAPLGPGHAIACTDVYRPGTQVPADATYSAFAIDAASGSVTDEVSFVGTAENTVVYMSPDALYVTYTTSTPRSALLGTFVREEFDRTPGWLDERVAEIRSYDISAYSTEREIENALRTWFGSLPAEERRTVRESFHEGFRAYVADHQRNLTATGIVRVGVDGDALSVGTTGTVPGRPLNQFSMSEHEGTLRIATTIPAVGSADSVNDLYTLDAESLDRRGAVTGMGENERVYAVRYVGDTAYVVTFRRIDPFHVVNLSDPANPEEVGQLELPGFSSYLHPVNDTRVLGIGEEDGRVKTVLFDVSDPSNPTIADDHVLDEHWSAVSESHHAFTIDRRHGVFFLPAGDAGVIMSYTNGSLAVEERIETDGAARRARYVENSLYVFADGGITVVNETTWEVTAQLDLDG